MSKRERSRSPVASRKRQAAVASTTSSTSSASDTISDTGTGLMPPGSRSTSSTRTSESSTTSPKTRVNTSDTTGTLSPSRSPSTAVAQPLVTATTMKVQDSLPAITTCAEMTSTGLRAPSTTREASHDGTIISAYVANGFKYPTAFGLLHYATTESFPNFRSGNVFIMTDLVHPRKAWQLHLSTLERHASFFALALRKHVDCGGYNGQWLYFLVAEEGGKVMLVEQVRGGDQLTFGYGTLSQDPLGGHVLIKVEDAEAGPVSQEMTVSIPNDKHQDVVDAYDQIFGAFYNIPLRIPLDSIEAALEVSEQLVNIACDMGCIALVESHIGNALLQFRQALFVAIKADPPCWLKLAFHLKNDSIYTEALIHLVGAHPCWPWSTTKRDVLPEGISRLVARKSEELDHMCLEVERDVLLLTIQVHKGPVTPQEASQFDT